LFCVDNDVCWQSGAMLKLIRHDKPFIAGVYPQRKDPIEWPVRMMCEADGGLREAEAVPFGFACLTRGCAQTVADAYADAAFMTARHGSERRLLSVFDPMTIDGRRRGEDYSFCHRWRAIGGRIWVDPDIHMGHVGPKLFDGRLGDAIGQS
jgi:hypothetical protein